MVPMACLHWHHYRRHFHWEELVEVVEVVEDDSQCQDSRRVSAPGGALLGRHSQAIADPELA